MPIHMLICIEVIQLAPQEPNKALQPDEGKEKSTKQACWCLGPRPRSGLKSIHSLMNSEALFLQYKFPCTTVKGLTLKRSSQSLAHHFKKIYVCIHEEAFYLLSWDFIKTLLPRGNSATCLTNLVIKAVSDGNYNPFFFFLLFSMSCCLNLQRHIKFTNKNW